MLRCHPKPALARWLLLGSTLAVALLSSIQPALAAGPRATALPGGPMYLCAPEGAPAGQRPVVVWTEGDRVVVTAAREREALPQWARQRSPLVAATLRTGAGVKAGTDGRFTLQWAGRTLACQPTHED